MNDAEYALHLVVSRLNDEQRISAWACQRTPRWRLFARRTALAVATACEKAATLAVREQNKYWCEQAAKKVGL